MSDDIYDKGPSWYSKRFDMLERRIKALSEALQEVLFYPCANCDSPEGYDEKVLAINKGRKVLSESGFPTC